MTPADNTATPWWRGGVIYQIYPRSFLDTNGDGVGDLDGITRKLDYIAALGVDGVWISPFFKSPMADFGYDVSDYRAIDPVFGTLESFDRLITGLKARGLKVIVDFVMSHTSDQHPWFTESRASHDNPKADWYVWADPKPDGTPPNNWMSVFGGVAWHFDTRRGQYYLHQFLKEQPDLNVRNPAVQDALLDTARFWLDRGVDGFRLDALNHCISDAQLRCNPPRAGIDLRTGSNRYKGVYSMQWHTYDKSQPETIPFLRRIRALLDQYPDAMAVAEVSDDHSAKTIAAYTGTPDLLHTAYSFSLMRVDYAARCFRDTLEEAMTHSKTAWPSWALCNHDIARTASRWAINGKPDPAQAKMLTALLTSLRGTAFLYQGEELGLTESVLTFEQIRDPFGIALWPTGKGRDGCRTPMPWDDMQKNTGFSTADATWLPMDAAHLPLSVAQQDKKPDSVLNFTRTFLQWRKNHAALRLGDIVFADTSEPVLAFTRRHAKQNIFCAFNLGDTPQNLLLPAGCTALDGHGLPHEKNNGDKNGAGEMTLPAFGGYFGAF